jgi:UPF0755 protein
MMPFTALRRSIIRNTLLVFLLLIFFLALYLFLNLRNLYSPVGASNSENMFEINTGSSLTKVSNDLANVGLVKDAVFFRLLAKWRNVENSIMAGEYSLDENITPAELLRKFSTGETLQYRVTLVEGWTFDEAIREIWRSEKVDIELVNLSKQEISEILGLEIENPEGMLFPDTYFYTKGTSDREILLMAKENLDNILADAWANRLGALPLESSYDALILASIIEKESSVNAERGDISGVFLRRIEQGMRLQSDPTVIYGLGSNFEGNITLEDLRNETTYNTYRINGLPPTPIALAGLDSIIASVNPVSSSYLYFVATGDGGHKFSSSLEEHNAAVNEYQR